MSSFQNIRSCLILLPCAWGFSISIGCSSSESESANSSGGAGSHLGGSANDPQTEGSGASRGTGGATSGSGGSPKDGDGTGGSNTELEFEGLPWDGQWSQETVATPGEAIHEVRIVTAQNGDSVVGWSRAEFVEYEVFNDFFEVVDWPRHAAAGEPEFLFECSSNHFDFIMNKRDDVLAVCDTYVGNRPSGGSWLIDTRELNDVGYDHTDTFAGWNGGVRSLKEGVWSQPVDVFPGDTGTVSVVALGSNQTVAFTQSNYAIFDGTDWSEPTSLPDDIKPTSALRSGDGAFVYSWVKSSVSSSITASYFQPGEGFSPPSKVKFAGASQSLVAAASDEGTLFVVVDRHAVLYTADGGWHEELPAPLADSRIAVDARGNAIVSWISNGFDGDAYDGLYVHRYIHGAGWTKEEQLNPNWKLGYHHDIAAGPDGEFSLIYMTSQSRIDGYRFAID